MSTIRYIHCEHGARATAQYGGHDCRRRCPKAVYGKDMNDSHGRLTKPARVVNFPEI